MVVSNKYYPTNSYDFKFFVEYKKISWEKLIM